MQETRNNKLSKDWVDSLGYTYSSEFSYTASSHERHAVGCFTQSYMGNPNRLNVLLIVK